MWHRPFTVLMAFIARRSEELAENGRLSCVASWAFAGAAGPGKG
jgi:hypothetical protein